MTFQPTVPLPGIGGWRFLERTQDAQQEVFNKSPLMARNVEYFKENIANATTVDALLEDRRLREVALGAFGLGDEIDKIAYLRKVLEEGTEADGAFANRLVDKRYFEFAETFGYGNSSGPAVGQSDFAERLTQAYQDREFEIAVGEADNNMRLVLTFQREIEKYNSGANSDADWFSIMGNPPLRTIFETAYGLPSAFGSLDVERQREDLKELTRREFGDDNLAIFQDPENVEILIRDFLARAQINSGPSALTPGSSALTLLQNSGLGATGSANLLLSNLS